jgi:hypothetical protein
VASSSVIVVRRRIHDRLGADIAAGAGPVLDDEVLPEPPREPLTDQARRDVDPAARGKTDNDADGPARIGLRSREARDSREHGSACGKAEKLTARGRLMVCPEFLRLRQTSFSRSRSKSEAFLHVLRTLSLK